MSAQKSRITLPGVRALYVPVMIALRLHGGESNNRAIADEVIEMLNITQEQLAISYDPPRDKESVFLARLTWARSHLKLAGYLSSPRRTVWKMTDKGHRVQRFRRDDLIHAVNDARSRRGF